MGLPFSVRPPVEPGTFQETLDTGKRLIGSFEVYAVYSNNVSIFSGSLEARVN